MPRPVATAAETHLIARSCDLPAGFRRRDFALPMGTTRKGFWRFMQQYHPTWNKAGFCRVRNPAGNRLLWPGNFLQDLARMLFIDQLA